MTAHNSENSLVGAFVSQVKMMAQSENNNQDTSENKQKTQKRKQKDGENNETVKSEDDTPMSKKIVPSFSSQKKCAKNVKTQKSKTSLKNSAIKKVTKKVKPKKKNAEAGNIDNSISDGKLKPMGVNGDTVMVDGETASLNSEQNVEEQSSMITNADSPTCKLQPLKNETDAASVDQDDATSKNKDNSISESKDLNGSEIPTESSGVETIVAPIPLLESDLKNPDSSSSSEMKQKSQNEDSEKFDSSDKKIIISSDTKSDELSGESKVISDNRKESNDQIISDKQQNSSSQNGARSDISSEVESCQPVVKQDTLIQDQSSLSICATDSRSQDVEMTQVCKLKQNDGDHSKNSDNNHQHEIQPIVIQDKLIQDQSSLSNCTNDSRSQDVEMTQVCKRKQNDGDHSKNSDNEHQDKVQPIVSQDKLIQDQSSLSNCMNDSRSQDVEMTQVCNRKQNDGDHSKNSDNEHQDKVQPIVSQDKLIQDQSSLSNCTKDSRSQDVEMTQVCKRKQNDGDPSKNSDRVKNSDKKHPDEEVVNSDDKSVDLVEVSTMEKDMIAPLKSVILTDKLKEEEKKESIVQSTKDFGFNQAPKISGCSSDSNIKDPVIFENDDIDLTDSQLCATEWTTNGDSLPENAHSKKTDMVKFKRAEKEGTLIVNELITELSRLNKLLLHFKIEIDAVWKRKKGSSVNSQQNVFKKRGPIQTLLGQFQ